MNHISLSRELILTLRHYQLKVEKEHLNRIASVHGGLLCVLVDVGGSLAVSAKTLNEYSGVSTDISVSFLSSAKLGDTLR